jgi:hypothetical protein
MLWRQLNAQWGGRSSFGPNAAQVQQSLTSVQSLSLVQSGWGPDPRPPVPAPPVPLPPVPAPPVPRPPVAAPPVFAPPVPRPPVAAPPVFAPPVFAPPVFAPPVPRPPVAAPPVFAPPVFTPPVFAPPVFAPPVFAPPAPPRPPLAVPPEPLPTRPPVPVPAPPWPPLAVPARPPDEPPPSRSPSPLRSVEHASGSRASKRPENIHRCAASVGRFILCQCHTKGTFCEGRSGQRTTPRRCPQAICLCPALLHRCVSAAGTPVAAGASGCRRAAGPPT